MASSASWEELLGSKRWEGLLDPLDLSLLELLLFCGDLCQVTYDAFDDDQHSRYAGSSRYGPSNLLRRALFPAAADLFVADFIYAASEVDFPGAGFFLRSLSREAWSKESNWIGFVAVSTDAAAAVSGRRVIYVAWRGTTQHFEWADVLQPELVPLSLGDNNNHDDVRDEKSQKVMKGWHTIYTSRDPRSPFSKQSARNQFLTSIKKLVKLYGGRADQPVSIVCTGHSLGACLAVLGAFDVVKSGAAKGVSAVAAVVFGCPQVGNKSFDDQVEALPELRVLQLRNAKDLIPHYPGRLLGFVPSGVELVVDSRKSPFLKDSEDPSDWHNLQAMLHAAAGWNGGDGEFRLRVNRSLALVNKSSNFLKDDYLIPASWWVEKNRGMVLYTDGEWRLAPPDADDIPVPPPDDSPSYVAGDDPPVEIQH